MGSNEVALGFSLWAEDQQQTQKDPYLVEPFGFVQTIPHAAMCAGVCV